MSNKVVLIQNPPPNNVLVTSNENTVSIVNESTTVNVTNPITNVVQVATPGPQGAMGPPGPSPDTSSFVLTSSFNAFTSSYNTGSFSGSFVGNLSGTSSWATNALTASYLSGYITPFPFTGSAVITGSLTVTGSINATRGITGSLLGTSSWATNALNADTANTANSANTAGTAFNANNISVEPSIPTVNNFRPLVIPKDENTSPGSPYYSPVAEIPLIFNPDKNILRLTTDPGATSTTASIEIGDSTAAGNGVLRVWGPVYATELNVLPTTINFIDKLDSGFSTLSSLSFISSSLVLSSGSFSGSFVGNLTGTSSWAQRALTASYLDNYIPPFPYTGDAVITGSLLITQNLTVLGSSSITYITASQLAVSASTISVNVFEPVQRFGGLIVYDSGSSQATASLLWDSQNNHWIYQNASGSTYSGGGLISGPKNFGALGSETYPTLNRLVKGEGGDHITNSNISDDGSVVSINSNTQITGSTIISSSAATQLRVGNNLLFVSSSGNVGIGTATPVSPLHIIYSDSIIKVIRIQNTNTGSTSMAGIQLMDSSGNFAGQFSYIPSNYITVPLRNSIIFTSSGLQKLGLIANAGSVSSTAQDIYLSTLGSNTTYQLTVKANGNVLINTNTDAGFRLDVNGPGTSGALRVSGSSVMTGSLTVVSGSGATRLNVTETGRITIGSDSTVTTQTSAVITPDVTNANLVIAPNGTGALVADMPDGASTGGNARGTNAVDLQTVRSAASQVASGVGSVLCGGERNSATNSYAVACGGFSNAVQGNRGGILSGESNTVAGGYASIAGGLSNSIAALSSYSFLGGGQSNSITSNTHAVVVGGQSNSATGQHSSIAGGQSNTATTQSATIGGGSNNRASDLYATVAGGQLNTGSGQWSFVGGGQNNKATTNSHTTVVGGLNNVASGQYSFVGSGQNVTASGNWSTAVGGSSNNASGNYAVIGGGLSNSAAGTNAATVGGGQSNSAGSSNATVGGGSNNGASGVASTVCGGNRSAATAINSIVTGGNDGRAYLYGQRSIASGQFGAAQASMGDAQTSDLRFRIAVTGTSSAELFLDGSSSRAALTLNTGITTRAWRAQINLAAIVNVSGSGGLTLNECFMGSYLCGIKNVGGTTSLIGAVNTQNEISDTNMATSVVTIDADDTNDSLRIRYTPPTTADATTVIRVVATAYLTEVAR